VGHQGRQGAGDIEVNGISAIMLDLEYMLGAADTWKSCLTLHTMSIMETTGRGYQQVELAHAAGRFDKGGDGGARRGYHATGYEAKASQTHHRAPKKFCQ
jgi:hypothetical protein